MSTFLKAEWRKLAMANFVVDPAMLKKYLPEKTEIDLWQGRCYVSLVGFMFKETTVKGLRIPFHIDFEEVNIRFYVRHHDGKEWKRGVVFISEIVPRPALSWVANTFYGEHYETMPMKHNWEMNPDSLTVTYQWKKKKWNTFRVVTNPVAAAILPGSEEEFITEHYWGYTKITETRTAEYGVEHERWKVYSTKDFSIDVDFGLLYGHDFNFLKNETPASVFVAEGSTIIVRGGRTL